MYREAWRIERDFFYDPGSHGLDLRKRRGALRGVRRGLGSRADLNYLFEEMLGNMVVGHLGVGGGEQPDVKRVQTGLLGGDYKIENGRYRFARVYNGENWNPQLRAPLTQPGVNVTAGEYLLAVNGRDVAAPDNVYSFFEATAGKQVQIRVGADPAGTGARTVTVVPVANENRLRNLAWIEDNRRKVDQMTGGRVAYVYLPDTASAGSRTSTATSSRRSTSRPSSSTSGSTAAARWPTTSSSSSTASCCPASRRAMAATKSSRRARSSGRR